MEIRKHTTSASCCLILFAATMFIALFCFASGSAFAAPRTPLPENTVKLTHSDGIDYYYLVDTTAHAATLALVDLTNITVDEATVAVDASVTYGEDEYPVTAIKWSGDVGTGDAAGDKVNIFDYQCPASPSITGGNLQTDLFDLIKKVMRIEIPASVKTIDAQEFRQSVNVTSVVFAEGSQLESLDAASFAGCFSLGSINLPDTVTTLSANVAGPGGNANNTFWCCTSLTSFRVPADVTAIPAQTFNGCTDLSTIDWGDSQVTSIDNNAFNSTGLTSLVIPSSVNSVGAAAFKGCASLASVDFSQSDVTALQGSGPGAGTFEGCTSLTSVNMGSITTLGSSEFSGCTGLTSFSIPDTVTSLGSYLFNGCVSLESAEIPANLTALPEGFFYGCTSLKSMDLPAGITNLASNAFRNCASLEKATIRSSGEVTLGFGLFRGSTSLKTVRFTGDVTKLSNPDGAVFRDNPLTSVVFTGDVTAADFSSLPSMFHSSVVVSNVTFYAYDAPYEEPAPNNAALPTACNTNSYTYHDLDDIDMANATLDITDATSVYSYTGAPVTPNISVSMGNGESKIDLTADTDYTVSYIDAAGDPITNPTAPGAYKVVVTGLDTYGLVDSAKEAAFEIVYPNGLYVYPEPVQGSDRYSTAAIEALGAYPEGTGGVVIVTGTNFPDALAAAGLAGMLGYPILLSAPDAAPDVTIQAIETLGAAKVVLCGGTSALSDAVENSLAAVMGVDEVTRIGGANRYATAQAIYDYGVEVSSADAMDSIEPWSDTALVVTGSNYPDALSLSSYAAGSSSPVFLAGASGLTADGLAAIDEDGFSTAIIAGGTSVVSADVEAVLVGVLGEGSIVRLGGDNRYETSKLVANWLVGNAGMSYEGAGIATGKNYPDALAGSVLLGSTDSVLLLADTGNLVALDALSNSKDAISHIRFLGGTNAVTPDVRAAALTNLGWSLS